MKHRPSACKVKRQPDKQTASIGLVFLGLAAMAGSLAIAEDWPTYQHDPQRSGVTSEDLKPPLSEVWKYTAPHAPQPAWPAPARQDFWHGHRELQPAVTYDRAFHVAVDNDAVYFGSSADDQVYCLDERTGRVRWTFFTEGPVRLAPTVSGSRVYVGSDDGWVYCLTAEDGRLLWKQRPSPEERWIPGNGRMISAWPVRTGVLVDGEVAYCGAGLFPEEGVYLGAFNASDGSVLWREKTDQASPQGYLLTSRESLFVPTGRTTPALFSRQGGKYQGTLGGAGGTFAFVTEDVLVSGPGRATGRVDLTDAQTKEQIASFAGLHLLVHGGMAYLHTQADLSALDRARYRDLVRQRNDLAKRIQEMEDRLQKAQEGNQTKQAETLQSEMAEGQKQLEGLGQAMQECFRWKQPCPYPYSLTLAGETLFAGGDNRVAAFRTADGQELWSAPVEGRAYGLAVAHGRLFVSTDRGVIHCYGVLEYRSIGVLGNWETGKLGNWETGKPICQAGTKFPNFLISTTPALQHSLPLHFKAPPHVRYLGLGEVLIAWETEQPGPGAVEYGDSPALGQRMEDPSRTTAHRVRLRGLKPDTDYFFRILSDKAPGEPEASQVLPFDSTSDLSPTVSPAPQSPYPEDELTAWYAQAAREIVARAGGQKGYCLDLGCGEGRLAYEIAKLTDLQIIGIEEDAEKVAAARKALSQAGIYGVRVTIHHGSLVGRRNGTASAWGFPISDFRFPIVQSLESGKSQIANRKSQMASVPYTPYFANLIVSDQTLVSGRLPDNRAEVLRLLRPCGGVACFGQPKGEGAGDRTLTRTEVTAWLRGASEGWQVQEKEGLWVLFRRGPLPGSGEWTHLYADASNSACSSDSLQAPLQVQWFGRPGPRNMIDRHHRAMSPLVKDGRVFIAGNNRVLAVDAYNGTLLWDVGIPHSRRIGAARDCGHLVATRDHVYVAAGEQCWGLDVETGEPSRIFETPPGGDGALHQWGYLASVGDLLFGSGEKPGASRTEHSRDAIVEGTYWDERPVVVSDTLFCLNRHTGERLWRYPSEGGRAIINSAIAGGGGHVYFVESRSPEALADGDGRVTLEVLLASGRAFLVKLHQETGQKVWERPVEELSPLRHVLFLSYAPGKVVAVGTRNDSGHPRYDLVAFDERDGSLLWSNHYLRADKGLNGDHGEQDQHPVIVGNTLYSRPYAFDLQTGQQVAFNLIQGGHGCGTISGSAFYLYGRGGNPRMYPLNAGGGSNIALTQVNRPGCWINILPAGSLVLIPEGSSGCTCGYPLQTSIAFVPQGDRAASGEKARD